MGRIAYNSSHDLIDCNKETDRDGSSAQPIGQEPTTLTNARQAGTPASTSPPLGPYVASTPINSSFVGNNMIAFMWRNLHLAEPTVLTCKEGETSYEQSGLSEIEAYLRTPAGKRDAVGLIRSAADYNGDEDGRASAQEIRDYATFLKYNLDHSPNEWEGPTAQAFYTAAQRVKPGPVQKQYIPPIVLPGMPECCQRAIPGG